MSIKNLVNIFKSYLFIVIINSFYAYSIYRKLNFFINKIKYFLYNKNEFHKN